MRALLAYGTGRYSDPWHPLADTAEALRGALVPGGFDVDVSDDLDGALERLDGVDLFVVNATDPWRNGESGRGASEAGRAGLEDAVARGIGILAIHNSISTLRDYPLWRSLVGGDWIPDVSMHPPLGPLRVHVDGGPIAPGDFTVVDEGYVDLEVDSDVEIFATHVHEGVAYPVMWTRKVGPTRVVYIGLGHDTRSYESPEHIAALQACARWAAGDGGA